MIFEYHIVGSEGDACLALNGCALASTEKDCGEWAAAALGKTSALEVSKALNGSPQGCYLYRPTATAEPKAYFNDGSKAVEKCSGERSCVCKCAPAVDVAFYTDNGGSRRGVHNIRQVLEYDEGLRVYNFSGKDVQTKLTKANGFDVVFFLGDLAEAKAGRSAQWAKT